VITTYLDFSWFTAVGVPTAALPAGNGQIQLSVQPSFYNGVYLNWSVPVYWGNCSFNIYRSQNDSTPGVRVNDAPLVTPFYFDQNPSTYSAFNVSYYTLEVFLANGAIAKSTPTTWTNQQSKWVSLRAAEIVRRENIFLNKFFGVPSLFFKKKYFGMRCPVCWNAQIEKVMSDHCTTCYGTGFNGGYWPAASINVKYDPVPNASTLGLAGVNEPIQIGAWSVNYPTIQTFDLVYRIPDAKMFRVSSVQSTELQAVRVRQQLALIELTKDSVEYQLTSTSI